MLCSHCMMALNVGDANLHKIANATWQTNDGMIEKWFCHWCGWKCETVMIAGVREVIPGGILIREEIAIEPLHQ